MAQSPSWYTAVASPFFPHRGNMTGDPHPQTFQSLPNQTATPDLTELQPKKLISFRIVSLKYHSYKQRPIRETPEEKKKRIGGALQPPFRQNKRNRKVDNAYAMPFLARKSGLNHSHPSVPPKNVRDLSEITRASNISLSMLWKMF